MVTILTAYGVTFLIPDGCVAEVEESNGEHDHPIHFRAPEERFTIWLNTDDQDSDTEKRFEGESDFQSQYFTRMYGENAVRFTHYSPVRADYGHEMADFYMVLPERDGVILSVLGHISFAKQFTIDEGYDIPELGAFLAGIRLATPEERRAARRTDA